LSGARLRHRNEDGDECRRHGRIVDLDNDKKAALVGNLLVVLCSDRGTQPIVNAGK
jgi:hypothetical protein